MSAVDRPPTKPRSGSGRMRVGSCAHPSRVGVVGHGVTPCVIAIMRLDWNECAMCVQENHSAFDWRSMSVPNRFSSVNSCDETIRHSPSSGQRSTNCSSAVCSGVTLG